MALSVAYIAALLTIVLLHHEAISISHHHDYHGLKSLHSVFYQHETINKTAYIIVNGVAGPPVGPTTLPFGTLFAFQDPLTITANPSSKVVGFSEGSSVTSGLDGLRSISVIKVTLNLKHHKGSISLVGVTHNTNPSNQTVVGGTGDFLFVQGYVTSTPIHLGPTFVYKISFNLYWPPYATQMVPSSIPTTFS